MIALYNFIIFSYYCGILISSLYNKKARRWIEGRKDIFKLLETDIKSGENIAWFHCASMGEFEQGRPVIEKFKSQNSKFKIFLTFFSPSGYEARKNYKGADYVFYLPLDTKKNAERLINIINPKIAVFIKYEFWYHYLNILHKRQIPTFLVSAVFRKKQHFFRWYGTLFRKLLRNFTHLFVQDEVSQAMLNSIGLKNHTISGDTRFDRVYDIAMRTEEIPLLRKFKRDKKIFIAGSTWQQDEKLLIQIINNYKSDLKFIIAPHEITEENIQRIITDIKHKTTRFSKTNDEEIGDAKVLIIDNIGMLSELYRYGDIAYIGGGFGKGIHNILEAAAFGMPVVFGPNFHKFREAKELIEKGGAFSITNYTELENNIRFLLSDMYVLKIASEINRNYVRTKKGAAGIVTDCIKQFV